MSMWASICCVRPLEAHAIFFLSVFNGEKCWGFCKKKDGSVRESRGYLMMRAV